MLVTETGLVGDRAFALIDRITGKVACAKNPRKWAKLLDCRASIPENTSAENTLVNIVLPDGKAVSSQQEYCDYSFRVDRSICNSERTTAEVGCPTFNL